MLSQDDRISFSKKIVEAPFAIDAVNRSKAALNIEYQKALKLDTAHKNLVDGKTALINAYQPEYSYLDGNGRNQLTEQDQQDAANFVLGNSLYPNDPNNPPPSTAPMIWTKTIPYARTKAIGKQNNETYTTVTKEGDLISAIQSSITSLQTLYTAIQLVTGQHCVNGGSCSNPIYLDQTTCVANGGTWTPTETIEAFTAIHTALTTLVTQVTSWQTFATTEAAAIYLSETDATRLAQNQAAYNYIQSTILPAIATWLAYSDFNTSHGQTTCAGFNSYNPTSLGNTKLQASILTTLGSVMTSRLSFITTRLSQLSTNLGSITQSLVDGTATGSGFYFERFQFLELRLNILGGSLVALRGFARAMVAQDDQIANITNSTSIYQTLLTCSIFAAPSSGTKTINVKNATGFAIGNNVFLVSDTQPEVVRTIQSIDGNRITLGQEVPATYRPNEFARVYKDIS